MRQGPAASPGRTEPPPPQAQGLPDLTRATGRAVLVCSTAHVPVLPPTLSIIQRVCIAGGKLNICALRKAVGVVCLAKGACLAHSRLARGEQSQLAWPVKHFGVLWEECCMKARSCCSLLLCRNIVINIWGMDPLGGRVDSQDESACIEGA